MSAPAPTRASPRAVLLVVGFAVFVAADDLTVVTTMLRPIIGDLGLVLPDGLDDAAWIVNVYLIAFVAVMPIAGRLSDLIGRRAMFAIAYALFLVGTVVIPLSDSLGPFLVGRVLTALGGGAMVPVALATVSDVHSEGDRARALGTLGAIETLGWVWGPMYGAVLVSVASWEWQFWLNIPFALAGAIGLWRVLDGHEQVRRTEPIDWFGAAALTTALVCLSLALLGNAEIQSVSGLDELTGGSGPDYRWFWIPALVSGAVFVGRERRVGHPLIARTLLRGRNLQVALVVNFVVGAVLVIAMVDVPIFINAVEVDIESSAVQAGWVLSALTAAMSITSYGGGRFTEATWYRPPVLAGLAAAVVAFTAMGLTWDPSTPAPMLAVQLALLGAGLGLVVAPTTSAVVDATPAADRGAAAALVMVVRLVGLSVGLAALTAWGLARFNQLRSTIELPPITDPGFQEAVEEGSARLTADAIAETFLAAAVVALAGVAVAALFRRHDTAPEAERPPPRRSREMPWLQRAGVWIVGALTAALILTLVLIAVLFNRLEQTRDDLARVEAGAALFASQVTGLSDQLLQLGPSVGAGIDEAIAGLEEFGSSTLSFTVPIDEVVEIDTEVGLNRTLQVPIRESIPINETIDTRIVIDTPIGIDVPVNVSVPVDIDVPIELDVDIPVDETIPISLDIPVSLEVPIEVDVAGTELADLATALAAGLRSLADVVSGLGG